MRSPAVANTTAGKRRTITLTNRPPIRIIEDDWPVVAQGMCGNPPDAPSPQWTIDIRVRKDGTGRAIIHANYDFDDPASATSQRVRVGRCLPVGADLTPNILAVGEELRERIDHQDMRKFVTCAIDACFRRLPPVEM